jgi:hypothetical protein
MEFRSIGTMILRWKGSCYKVLAVRSSAKDLYSFECKSLKTNQNETFKFSLNIF